MLSLTVLLKAQSVDTISLRGTYYITSAKKETYIQNRKVVSYYLGRYVRIGDSYNLEEIMVNESIYQLYQDSTNNYFNQLAKCKPCWQRNYTFTGQLVSEGLRFTDCMVGDFRSYYSNGKIYISASYKQNESNDWKNLYERKLCGQDGIERYYSTDGKLIKTNFYSDGKLVNCIE